MKYMIPLVLMAASCTSLPKTTPEPPARIPVRETKEQPPINPIHLAIPVLGAAGWLLFLYIRERQR